MISEGKYSGFRNAITGANRSQWWREERGGGGDLDDQGIAGKQGGGEGVEDVVEGVIPGNDCTNLQHGKE